MYCDPVNSLIMSFFQLPRSYILICFEGIDISVSDCKLLGVAQYFHSHILLHTPGENQVMFGTLKNFISPACLISVSFPCNDLSASQHFLIHNAFVQT